MFDQEQKIIEKLISKFIEQNNLPETRLNWAWIPFSGHWGISTSLFSLAAAEARQNQNKINVSKRANELALQLVSFLGNPEGFEKIEAVNGYLNLYFSQTEYTKKVLESILIEKENFGRLPRKNQKNYG